MIKDWFYPPKKPKTRPQYQPDDVAIVGIACRFPGADNYREFWRNLEQEVNSVREISKDRWDIDQYYSPEHSARNRSVSKWGGLLQHIDTFDSHFFHISPREAEMMDPQQRLLLEETWHCIEDSGIALQDLQAGNTSVYVGSMASDYHQYLVQADHSTNGYDCLGNYPGILSNRLSYFFNFTGESVSIDAACASSLVSIHEARDSLITGKSQYAIAAGVSIICHPWKYISFSKARMLSPDGLCKTFDASANGYVPGEGAGVVLLERLEQAIQNGHTIYGVIKGSGVHHGGRSKSITAPSLEAQQKLITEVLQASNVSAESIGYVEAHGTGTSLGDPIEVAALTKAFNTTQKQYCLIGSVKTNIGHLEGAAGVAGVIKVLMMFKHRKIPKTLNIKVLNPIIDFARSPFRVAEETQIWNLPPSQKTRRAGISSFGFGGVDAHLILEEYIQEPVKVEKKHPVLPFILSAQSQESLDRLLSNWQAFIQSPEFSSIRLENIGYILMHTRESFPYKWGTIVQSKRELALSLSHVQYQNNQLKLDKKTLVLRINPGMDVDYESFHVIAQQYPILKQLDLQCTTALASIKNSKKILKNIAHDDSAQYKNLRTFIVYYALSKSLLLTGLKPHILLGSGVGELVEAVLADMLSLEHAMLVLIESKKSVMLHRPVISLYEKHNNIMLSPYMVPRNYCHKLTEDITIDRKPFETLVEKTKLLVINQFTFKKYLAGWDEVFKKYHISLEIPFVSLCDEQRTLLCIAILYCMKKLNLKWGLDERKCIKNVAMNEIIDLILDQILSYEDAANLVFNQTDSMKESLAEIIRNQEHKMDPEKSYRLLKELNQSVSDISNPELWLKKMMNDHTVIDTIPEDKELHFFIDLGLEHLHGDQGHILLDLHDLSENIPEFLLELWLHEIPVNWRDWYEFDKNSRSASLPSYPFIPERHWFSNGKKDQKPVHSEEQKPELLLSDKPVYLHDHVVRERIVLPAALYLEWIRASALKKHLVVTEFHHVLWSKPVYIQKEETPLDIQIESGTFKVITMDNGKPVIHAEGNILDQTLENKPKNLTLDFMKRNPDFERNSQDIYAHFNQIGLHYGPFYQVIQHYWGKQHEALAEIALPENPDATFMLHPAILDGALQTCICLLTDREALYLPFSMEKLEIFDTEFSAVCYVWAQMIPDSESHHVPKFNIHITNHSGSVLIRIQHFTLRAVQAENKNPGVYYYHPVWQPKPAQKNHVIEPLLMFNHDQKQADFFIKKYPHLTIKNVSADADRFDDVITRLVQENALYSTIIYKTSLYHDEDISAAVIDYQLQQSFFTMLSLVQALMRHKIHQSVDILFVNEVPSGKSALFTESLAGFMRTIHLENPHISCRMLHIPASEKTVELMYEELGMQEQYVRYNEQMQRLVEHIEEVKPQISDASLLRHQGVYLITGGTGGLGHIFADYLARIYQAKIILIGRSELNDMQKNRIQKMEQSGAELHYIRHDIGNMQEAEVLKNAIDHITSIFGPLNGVFHAAGLLEDAFILEKNREDAAKVLNPKIYGTALLDEITKDAPLDFFLMFSSMVSVFGNVGQCDYAYANHFMDSYAQFREKLCKEHRREGKSIAINWPLWRQGGMQLNEIYQAGLLNKLGLIALETEAGITAFLEALQQDYSQFIVLSGYKNKIESTLAAQSTISHKKTPPDHPKISVDESILEEKTTELLKEILSGSLNIAPEKINPQEPFELYGIDSLMIVNLNQALEKTFKELPQTLFFEYLTLEELVGYFTKHHKADLLPVLKLNPVKKIEYEAEKIPEMQEKTIPDSAQNNEDIAIIGLSGKYPEARNLDIFWENLKNGQDSIREIPQNRWDYRKYFDPDKEKSGTIYSKWGGFIEDVEKFDPLFFNITPNEATYMDPQERLFLETAWNAIEDAGYTKSALSNQQIGVFVGVMYDEYQFFGVEESQKGHITATNPLYAYIANRVSYYFNFHGPSISLDTMCSSSLTTIHLACQSIKLGECDMAIAGGVNLNIHPNKYIFLSRGKFLASDGRCKSFGVGGDGYVPGEGVGAIVLKSLSKALEDGDHIYGVIKGSSINHCGKTNGFTVPSPTAQAALIERALENAKINPDSISYIEAHGTGTSLGDPIEMAGLNKALGNPEMPKTIGSVKSNIGHLESAAGIAAVSKVLLQMRYKHLVPSLHSQTLNPNINWNTTPFVVQQDYAFWDSEYPRRASISSFGAGGSNAHIIMEEAPEMAPEQDDKPWYLIPLSAKTEKALIQKIQDLQNWIDHKEQVRETFSLTSLSFTLQTGREHFNHRKVFIVDTREKLKTELRASTYQSMPDTKSEPDTNSANALIDELRNSLNPMEYKNILQQLADLYINKVHIDWSLLYQGTHPHKISLPTYPFEKKRYWIEQTENSIIPKPITHPLLDNTESPEHLFSKRMHPHDFYLQDHRVHGVALLPGTAYLELVRASASFDAKKEVTSITNMFWEKPFIIEQEPKTLFVQLDSGNFTIYQKQAGSDVICSEGQTGYEALPKIAHLDLDAIRSRCTFTINKETIYHNLKTMGFDYGPAFQVSNQAWINDTEVLVELTLPEFMKKQAKEFILHPSLMDGALRATFGHAYTRKSEAILRVPFSMNALYIYKPVQDTCFAYAKSENNTPDIFDITITNPLGEVLVFIQGFLTRTMNKHITNNAILLFRPEWMPAQLEPKITASSNPVLIFAKSPFPLPSGIQAIWIHPGNEYQKISDHTYQIKPDSVKDYQLLFTDLNQPTMQLLHLFNLPDTERGEDLSLGLYSVTALCHALKNREDLRLLCVFHSLKPDDSPALEAVSGLMHTMKILKPTWNMSLLGMDEVDYKRIFMELFNPAKPDIRYQHNERLIRRFVEITNPVQTKPLAFRKQGVYIITGGLGGLGFIFADYLATHYQARLVLTGRRRLDADSDKKIKNLEQKGAEVLYLSADITLLQDVEYLYKKTKEQWHHIHGIIHAAGVFPTQSFFDTSQQEFNQALAPKIAGTVYLDKVTATETLDYFIVFSSISSELGDYGACSYATGNRFMDSYMALRDRLVKQDERTGKSLSVNWPYWSDGGMRLTNQESTVYFDYLGMKALDNQAGLKVFETIIGLEYPQILVTEGDREKIEKALGKSVKLTKTTSAPPKTNQSGTNLQSATEDYLKKILYSITQIPTEELESNKPWEEYGIDSVMILKFNSILNKDFSQLRNTLLFEYRTINALASYLIQEQSAALSQLTHTEEAIPETIMEEIPPNTSPTIKEDIAIIGMGGRYPEAYDLQAFWNNLKQGKDCIEEIPENRWDFKPVYMPEIQAGKTVSKWGGFIEDADKFDSLFFNISAREAEQMDPQERLFLETVWATLEDAGYTPEALHQGSQGKIGVFAGLMWNEYQLFHEGDNASLFASNNASLANRISFFLDLHGPSMVIDTACSSSLVAIHLACESILQGHCNYAIAGGVNLSLAPQKYISLSQLGMLSKKGRCRSFGDDSDGYVPGEGVGAVLLKPLSQAIADKDRIYAVIKGSSMNHGGKTHGYTVPNPDAQASVIRDAIVNAGISPDTISYVEAHGTGTPLGDPVEITGLCKAFGSDITKQSCALGSVKSNIGHLEGAAGISALTKVVLQLKNRQLVPSLHAEILNPHIDFSNTPFFIQKTLQPWNSNANEPLRAGISSFGAGGTNAHVIVESFPQDTAVTPEKSHYLITLSAKTVPALLQKIRELATWLQDPEHANVSLADISYTLNTGRVSFEKRYALVSDSVPDLLKKLDLDQGVMGAYNKKEYQLHADAWKASSVLLLEELSHNALSSESRKEKLNALAELYIAGLDIPWNKLYAEEKPHKITLPTYPFARERHWLNSASENIPQRQNSDKAVDFIRSIIAETTKIDISRIDKETNFEAFGIDSIMIARLNQALEKHFGKLPSTLFFTWHTAEELASWLSVNHGDTLNALLHISETPASITHPQKETLPLKADISSEDIAIIGYQGEFPQAKNITEFWENLKAGRNSIVNIPESRWDYKQYYEQIQDKRDIKSGKIYCKWGGFIEDVDKFDAELFHISPKDAVFMDPQERLFMQCVFSSIEAAGYTPETLVKKDSLDKVGVFVGVSFNNYQLICAEAMQNEQLVPVVSSQIFSVANRVSYFFNFHGPSIPIDTACSSSLYAIHLACESIQRGECAVAVAGATNLSLHPSKYATLCSGGFLASDGQCHAFGEGGDGYVPGEGVGALILKSLSKAIEDKDFIYGLIKGSAVSHDGKTNGYTVPNPLAQAQAIEAAVSKAGIDPGTISYIEAHGTGTPLGDPVEIAGLCEVYQRNHEKQYCAIGSVKSNIGHLESAAGIAQIVKVLLQMSNETLVPSLLHGRNLNPKIDFENSPFYVEQALEHWKQPEINGQIFPRRAGISSFGAGGTNAHVILEAYKNPEADYLLSNPAERLIILSASGEEQLKAYAESLLQFLKQYHTENPVTGRVVRLQDIAYTLQTGRLAFDHRLAFTVQDIASLIEQLSLYIMDKQSTQRYQGQVSFDSKPTKIDPLHETNPEVLAELWTHGHVILWNNLYTQNKPQRIYLPTHIFKKSRFWVNTPKKLETVKPVIAPEIRPDKQATAVSFLKSINKASEADKLKKIMLYCQQKVAVILEYPESQLPDPDTGFFDLGLESLLALKLQQELEDELGINIPDTSMFLYPTIRDLAKFFIGLITPDTGFTNTQDDAVLNDIDRMSEAEVIASLKGLLPP